MIRVKRLGDYELVVWEVLDDTPWFSSENYETVRYGRFLRYRTRRAIRRVTRRAQEAPERQAQLESVLDLVTTEYEAHVEEGRSH